MGIIPVSKRDLLRSKVVKPGLYRVRILNVDESLSKKGDSTNYRLEGEVVCSYPDNDTEFAGVPTPYLWYFNDKAAGMMIPLYEAITGEKVEEGSRLDFSNNALAGRELIVRIDNEKYQGRIVNSIVNEYHSVG